MRGDAGGDEDTLNADYKARHTTEVLILVTLKIEIENLTTDYSTKEIIIPCDLRAELEPNCDYVVVSCEPYIPMGYNDDIKGLNEIIETINSESPGMTNDLLRVLLEASGENIFDDTFLRKIVTNDFMFEDISGIQWKMGDEEIAACYLMTVLRIPFDPATKPETIDALCDDSISDYISWEGIWNEYETLGFRVIVDLDGENYGRYLIHWKE